MSGGIAIGLLAVAGVSVGIIAVGEAASGFLAVGAVVPGANAVGALSLASSCPYNATPPRGRDVPDRQAVTAAAGC